MHVVTQVPDFLQSTLTSSDNSSFYHRPNPGKSAPPTMPPSAFPRIHISCPCVETRESVKPSQRRSHSGTTPPLSGTTTPRHSRSRSIAYDEEEEGATFDPWDVRANYSLFPLDNLLYCEDCGQVRCPRCVNEEIVCYFCPNCLFEVPSATVKAEGNRWASSSPEDLEA